VAVVLRHSEARLRHSCFVCVIHAYFGLHRLALRFISLHLAMTAVTQMTLIPVPLGFFARITIHSSPARRRDHGVDTSSDGLRKFIPGGCYLGYFW
jgi:hypothetical protein